MDAKGHWEAVYRAKRPDEVSWFQVAPNRSLALIGDLHLPQGAEIIDVGAGASTLVDHLLEIPGWRVTVLDVAAAALEHSRKRLGARADRVRWVVADVTAEMDLGTCDLWHDRAVFHFLSDPAGRAGYMENLRRTVKPRGFVLISTFAPDGPQKCSGLDVVRYDAAALRRELGPGFTLVREEREEHTTPWGASQRFTYALFHRGEHP